MHASVCASRIAAAQAAPYGKLQPSAISTMTATIGTQQAAIKSQAFQPPFLASPVSCCIAYGP